VVHLWDRGVDADEPCGCGCSFHTCPFWTAVGERAYGGWHQLDVEEIRRDREKVDRNRFIPFLLAPSIAPRRFRESHQRLALLLSRLYIAADESSEESGASTRTVALVDSSKHPSYLFLLRSIPELEVRLLHVVRDPRGVAHSWSKHVKRPENGEEMERLGLARACLRWTTHNLLFQLAQLLHVRTVRLPYERFAGNPQVLQQVAEELLVAPTEIALSIDCHVVDLAVDHTVSGNPMRFDTGEVTVRRDDQWRTTMPAWRRRAVAVLTFPLRQIWSR
jgi:hypothetical protein